MTSKKVAAHTPLKTLLLFFGLALFSPAIRTVRAQSVPATAGHILGGQLDAPIRMDVFSDFQCPACAAYYLETVRPILRDYSAPNKVCVVYHEFPLVGHPHSREAARWSVAAQRTGTKAWLAVVDALYSRQAEWSQSGKVELTASSALSPEEYMSVKRALLSPDIDKVLDSAIELGRKLPLETTPTTYVYFIGREQKFAGGLPYAALKGFFDRIVR